MKLVFHGAQMRKNGGCPVCGARKSIDGVALSKSYILPSGKAQTFHTGRTYEVSDRDGEFLLSYVYKTKDGEVHKSFEKVDG